MTAWIKVFNSMPSHPKFVRAGDRASWLFLCGCCYANEHLTDGFVPADALAIVAPGARNARKQATVLVAVGLWHETDGGWLIHDYAEYQRSATEIRQRRVRDRQRKSGGPIPRGIQTESARNPDGIREAEVEVEVEVEEKEAKASSRRGAVGADDKASDEDRANCRLLLELATQRNPKFKAKAPAKWLTDMRLLRERDRNSADEIERTIRWLFTDTGDDAQFWADVIQSPANLRDKFPRIWAKMHADTRRGRRPAVESSADVAARMARR